jgi:3-methyladenine DNA glycosylase AlkD
MWHIHKMEYYSSIKTEGNPATCDTMDESWVHYDKWNKLGIEGKILHDSMYMSNIN